jgi:hypothetical protein
MQPSAPARALLAGTREYLPAVLDGDSVAGYLFHNGRTAAWFRTAPTTAGPLRPGRSRAAPAGPTGQLQPRQPGIRAPRSLSAGTTCSRTPICVLDEASHRPFVDAHDAIAAAVTNFLAGHSDFRVAQDGRPLIDGADGA